MWEIVQEESSKRTRLPRISAQNKANMLDKSPHNKHRAKIRESNDLFLPLKKLYMNTPKKTSAKEPNTKWISMSGKVVTSLYKENMGNIHTPKFKPTIQIIFPSSSNLLLFLASKLPNIIIARGKKNIIFSTYILLISRFNFCILLYPIVH